MIIGLIIVVIAGLGLLAFISQASHKKPAKPIARAELNPNIVYVKWQEIKDMLKAESPSSYKNALIEADKLLDYVLKGRGYSGETMAQRLKHAQDHIDNREAVWQAHKLRNNLVHEVEHDLVPTQVKSAVHAIGQAIQGLGVKI